MLVLDPIVLFLGILLAFVYGLLYLFLTAYPIVYQQIHGFNPGVGSLPYLSMMVGQFLSALAMILYQPWFYPKVKANNGRAMPEWHLAVSIYLLGRSHDVRGGVRLRDVCDAPAAVGISCRGLWEMVRPDNPNILFSLCFGKRQKLNTPVVPATCIAPPQPSPRTQSSVPLQAPYSRYLYLIW